MNSFCSTPLVATLCLLALCLSGCGDGRQPVSGSVTLDGKPLAWGTIVFQPADGGQGRNSGASIVDGNFDLPRQRGLVPGTYRVKIEAIVETNEIVDDDQMGRMRARKVVELENAAFERQIGSQGERDMRFELTPRRPAALQRHP